MSILRPFSLRAKAAAIFAAIAAIGSTPVSIVKSNPQQMEGPNSLEKPTLPPHTIDSRPENGRKAWGMSRYCSNMVRKNKLRAKGLGGDHI